MMHLESTLLLLLGAMFRGYESVTHETTLLWTEKGLNGDVKIMGIPGEPSDWIKDGNIRAIAQAYPSDPATRAKSHRIALAFLYKEQRLIFSDRGFREIYKIQLRRAPSLPFIYNVTVESVFSGISAEVNGMAMDWVSGSLYWTDARYNWITVARSENNSVFRHLITTGLDSPHGIAVHPREGMMFWSDWGARPRIERSNLGGEDRMTFVDKNVIRPLGVAVDYATNDVYWVDDSLDTIERVDIRGQNRHSIKVDDSPQAQHNLFGMAIYENYIFLTDQWTRSVTAFDKEKEKYLGRFVIQAIPYDVMMYDEDLQKSIDSACTRLACEHLCISEANGGGHCICGQNYELNGDGQTCSPMETFLKPQYIYSIGSSLCGVPIHTGDKIYASVRSEVTCFLNGTNQAEALAFDARADLLFFSETGSGTLSRMRLVKGERPEPILLNRGQVRGIAVDWLSNNLYWTDEVHSHVMVSRYDGSDAAVLVSGVYRPRGIAVDPVAGLLYWATGSKIYTSHMDGTNVGVFVSNCTMPDGLVLDMERQSLLWADRDGIHQISLNGSDHRVIISSSLLKGFRDVTVYQDYVAWTDGEYFLHFTTSHQDDTGSVSALRHSDSPISHDVITYDTYLQPLHEGQCDDDNNGCEHLCLPTPSGPQCLCAIGFYLHTDGKSCVSDLWTSSFVLFLEPHHRRFYQLHLGTKTPLVQGVDTSFLEDPTHVAYDQRTHTVYWYERAEHLIKYVDLDDVYRSRTLVQLKPGSEVHGLDVSSYSGRIFFIGADTKTIFYIQTTSREPQQKVFYTGSKSIIDNTLNVDEDHDLIFWAETSGYRETTIYRTTASSPDGEVVPEGITVVRRHITGISIDVNDASHVYYWTDSVVMRYSTSLRAEEVILDESSDALYRKVFIDGHLIYLSDQSLGSVAIYDQVTRTQTLATDPIFSNIVDMKIVKGVPKTICGPGKKVGPDGQCRVDTPQQLPSSHENSADNRRFFIIIGAASGAVVLLTTIIVVVCLARRKKQRKTSKASKQPQERTAAHDNPTYMTPEEAGLPAVTVVMTPGSSQSNHNDYEHLPGEGPGGASAPHDAVLEASLEDEKKELDLGPEVCPEIPSEDSAMGTDPRVTSVSDTVQLVDHEEVTVQVSNTGDSQPSVLYTSNK